MAISQYFAYDHTANFQPTQALHTSMSETQAPLMGRPGIRGTHYDGDLLHAGYGVQRMSRRGTTAGGARSTTPAQESMRY